MNHVADYNERDYPDYFGFTKHEPTICEECGENDAAFTLQGFYTGKHTEVCPVCFHEIIDSPDNVVGEWIYIDEFTRRYYKHKEGGVC